MKLSKRVEPKVDYWYCSEPKCPAGLTGHHQLSTDEAEAHVRDSGHEARVVKTEEHIIRPADLEAAAR